MHPQCAHTNTHTRTQSVPVVGNTTLNQTRQKTAATLSAETFKQLASELVTPTQLSPENCDVTVKVCHMFCVLWRHFSCRTSRKSLSIPTSLMEKEQSGSGRPVLSPFNHYNEAEWAPGRERCSWSLITAVFFLHAHCENCDNSTEL